MTRLLSSAKIQLLLVIVMSSEQRTSEIPQLPLVHFALSYAQNGWPVFPLHGKIPLKDSRGYKDATTDLDTIQVWWSQHPTANIGVATGKVSGVIVLDIDPRNAEKSNPNPYRVLEEHFGRLPVTRTVRTANGGLHKYFQHPQDSKTYANRVKLAGIAGVDVRGDGGYVVLPPSQLYGWKSYTWANPTIPIAQAPDWLLDALTHQHREIQDIPHRLRFAHSPGEKWLAEALMKATTGSRNQIGFQLALQLRDDGLSEAEAKNILLSYANRVLQPSCSKPYTEAEALKSVKSAYSREKRDPARRQR